MWLQAVVPKSPYGKCGFPRMPARPDFLQPRFWITSVWPTIHEQGSFAFQLHIRSSQLPVHIFSIRVDLIKFARSRFIRTTRPATSESIAIRSEMLSIENFILVFRLDVRGVSWRSAF